jgi:hypothetical protein
MSRKTAYESGARKYPARTGPDPSDDFSQDAAGNKPPSRGGGLTEKVDTEKKRARHPDDQADSLEREHVSPSPRDTREAPSPNPKGGSR